MSSITCIIIIKTPFPSFIGWGGSKPTGMRRETKLSIRGTDYPTYRSCLVRGNGPLAGSLCSYERTWSMHTFTHSIKPMSIIGLNYIEGKLFKLNFSHYFMVFKILHNLNYILESIMCSLVSLSNRNP